MWEALKSNSKSASLLSETLNKTSLSVFLAARFFRGEKILESGKKSVSANPSRRKTSGKIPSINGKTPNLIYS